MFVISATHVKAAAPVAVKASAKKAEKKRYARAMDCDAARAPVCPRSICGKPPSRRRPSSATFAPRRARGRSPGNRNRECVSGLTGGDS